MSLKLCTVQACAACKYQRRKCTKDCLLAPYFPGDQPKLFRNAHRLFGVSNILKILKRVPKEFHEEAMRSVIYESNMRARFPVHGCWEVICRLHFQLERSMEELNYVRSCIAACKRQCNYQIVPPSFQLYPSPQLDLNKDDDYDQSKVNLSRDRHSPSSYTEAHQLQDYFIQEETALSSDDNEDVQFGRIASDGHPCLEFKENTDYKRSWESSAVK